MSDDDSIKYPLIIIAVICVIGLVLLAGGCAIHPIYSVWQQEKEGQAEYARAEGNRKIAVLQAQAKLDSAKLLADSEVARARGVAEANKIIGESLKGNDAYLRYLWIQGLAEGGNPHQVIYVPTEANLPILEASRKVPGATP